MPDANRLVEIKQLHGEVEGALRTTLPKAIRIGELLTEQKAELGHGHWGEWVADNLPFCPATDRNYRTLFKRRKELKTLNVSTLAEAYSLLRSRPEQKRKRKDDQTPEADPSPSVQAVRLELPEQDAAEYGNLTGWLMENVRNPSPQVPSPEWVALQALRVFKQQELAKNGARETVGEYLRRKLGGKSIRQVVERPPLRLVDKWGERRPV